MRFPSARLQVLLVAAWLGMLLAVSLMAAPSAFKVLDRTSAGLLVGRLFAIEAPTSVGLGVSVLVLEGLRRAGGGLRWRWDGRCVAPLVAILCTAVGYYLLQPWMAEARGGQGPFTFGQLHAVSLGLYGLKVVTVASLAWIATRTPISRFGTSDELTLF